MAEDDGSKLDKIKASLDGAKDSLINFSKSLKDALKSTEELTDADRIQAEAIKELIGGFENLKQVQDAIKESTGDNSAEAKEYRAELNKIAAAFKEAEAAAKDMQGTFGGLQSSMSELGLKGLADATDGVAKYMQAQEELRVALEAGTITQEKYNNALMQGRIQMAQFALGPATRAFEKIFSQTIKLATATIDTTKGLQRFYGASDEVAKGLINMQDQTVGANIDLSRLGVTSTEIYKAFETMRSEFVLLSGDTMKANQDFVKFGATLEKVGVETAQFGKTSNTLNRVFGQNAEGTRDFASGLNDIGVAQGLGPGELVSTFNELSPQILKIGKDTSDLTKTMNNLAYASRQTGIEMGRIADFAAGFDTFEGAADRVGKLNAILGGDFLNVMDLMAEEDPAKRFQMITDVLKDQNKTFQDMAYYERLAIAEAGGFKDVGELALAMSGNFDLMSNAVVQSQDSFVEAAKRARNFQEVQEELQNMLVQIANTPGFRKSVIGGIETFIDFMDFIARHGRLVIGILGTLTIVTKTLAAANLYLAFSARAANAGLGGGPTKMGLGGIGFIGALMAIGFIIAVMTWGSNLIDVVYALSFAMIAIGVASRIAGNGMNMGMVKVLLALGGAVLLAMAGIALAAEGIASMADSVSNLNAEQLAGFNNALIGLVGTLALFTAGIVALGIFATGPQLLGILGLGAAFMMIGVGIGVAAAGMGKLAEGFAKLFDTGATGGALLGMAAGLYAMAGSLTVFAAALAILTPAIMVFQAAMAVGRIFGAGPSQSDIQAFSTMVESLASISPDNLTKTVEQVSKLRKEMSNMMESPDMIKDFTDMLKVFERDMQLAATINMQEKEQKAELTITSPITIKVDDNTQLIGKIDERVLAKLNFTRS